MNYICIPNFFLYFFRTNYLIANRYRIFLVSLLRYEQSQTNQLHWSNCVCVAPPRVPQRNVRARVCVETPKRRPQPPAPPRPTTTMMTMDNPRWRSDPNHEIDETRRCLDDDDDELDDERWWPEQPQKQPSVRDDADGHLIYHTGDILHNRCSWSINLNSLLFFFLLLPPLPSLYLDRATPPRRASGASGRGNVLRGAEYFPRPRTTFRQHRSSPNGNFTCKPQYYTFSSKQPWWEGIRHQRVDTTSKRQSRLRW